MPVSYFHLPKPVCLNMNKICFLGVMGLFVGSSPLPAQTCLYRLDMSDGYGDGWNGGVLNIVNGGAIQQFFLSSTVGNGSDSTVYFPVKAGWPLTLVWSAGFFDEEVSFTLYDNDGEVLYSLSSPSAGILFLLPEVRCYSCLRPLAVQVENLWDTRARLSWTPPTGTISGDWRVIYDRAGFRPDTGGFIVTTALPRVLLTGLQPNTEYDAYIQQQCEGDSLSRLKGPVRFRTYRTNDVGMSAILEPQSGCSLGIQAVKVALRNSGAAPQTLIPFNFSVNGVPAGVKQPQDGFYTGILGKDSTVIVSFETPYDFSAPGEYLIAAWTELKGDENRANDTAYVRIVGRVSPPYFQDFEQWEGGWSVEALSEGSSWEWGVPAGDVIRRAGSAERAWVTHLAGDYLQDEYSYLRSPCLDFSGLTHDPVVEFLLHYDTESGFDGAWLELSTDGGVGWTPVGELYGGINGYNRVLLTDDSTAAWSGNSGGWVPVRQELVGTAGKDSVRLRFVFRSDGIVSREGVGIDAVRVYAPEAVDVAALQALRTGEGTECGLESDTVEVQLANFGRQPLTAYRVAYSVSGQSAVIEDVKGTLIMPNRLFTHRFSEPIDSRDADFALNIRVETIGDTRSDNDTVSAVVYHRPLSLPLREDFEAGLPPNWKTNGEVTNGHNNTSYVLSYNLYFFQPTFYLLLPRYGPVRAGDTLSFEYRITDYDSDGKVGAVLSPGTYLEVLVSTDCGESFAVLHTINHKNHLPTASMRRVRLDLSPYAGEAVVLRIVGFWSEGDFYFDLDDIYLPANVAVSTWERPESEGPSLRLWPNPTTDVVYLSGQGGAAAEWQLQLFDAAGRLCWERRLFYADSTTEVLNLGGIPAGMYWLRILAPNYLSTHKLVKH